MMEIKVPPQRRRYLNRMVQSGQFRSESDVVDFALRRLKQDSRDAAWLKREL
jgi:putative addiction module CopG family antidote